MHQVGLDHGPRDRPASTRHAIAQFVATGLAALALVGIGGGLVLHSFATDEALRDGASIAKLVAHGIIEPAVTPALLAGDPDAIARLGAAVRSRALDDPIVRIKVWTEEGRIVFSDEERLIGNVFELEPDELAALRSGTMSAPHISDLAAPENHLEDEADQLMEVYVPIRSADGEPLLVESYLRLDSILASGQVIAGQFLPVVVVALVMLAIVQWPLAWRLARELRRGHEAQERLLRHAIDSSHAERRRIAADLHDGLVQSLAGVSFDLAAAANEVADPTASKAVQSAAASVRSTVQEARSLLVDLYPPNLDATGLANAVTDLAASLSSRGVTVVTDIDDELDLDPSARMMVYRVIQEALRNVQKHADARHVSVQLAAFDGAYRVTIDDDGVGVGAIDLEGQRRSGHIGLNVLHDLARDAGANVEIHRRQPTGTTVRLVFGTAP